MADHKKHKQSAWQKRFSSGFTGKSMGIKKPKKKYKYGEEARERIKKEKEKKKNSWF